MQTKSEGFDQDIIDCIADMPSWEFYECHVQHKYPALAYAAIRITGRQVKGSSVETLNSTVGWIHNDTRNRLGDKTTYQLVNLRSTQWEKFAREQETWRGSLVDVSRRRTILERRVEVEH